ncbi:MAG TPA: glycoside hydrolase family 88 protein [Puia sp.]|nr:glycoside hydrolase family 88 protein [Puia sp.]
MGKVIVYSILILAGLRADAREKPAAADTAANPRGWTELREARRLGNEATRLWPDSADGRPARWTYEEGVVWLGMLRLWYSTGDARYFNYVKRQVDRLVDKEGNIATYKAADYSLDNILCGRVLLQLFAVTEQPAYFKAAVRLREQLRDQPRTAGGSFWHKKKYARQVWLDGIYMALPFWAQYAGMFHEDSAFGDIARQFAAIERHTRDPKTGLLYHGWDESGTEKWAVHAGDPTSGHSPSFWARAMGWYGMALVDVLDYFPKDQSGRAVLLDILQRYAAAVRRVQDRRTGLWWDVLDQPGRPGNYPEASASAMFVYTLARGAREGYLPAAYGMVAKTGARGIERAFISRGGDSVATLHGTVSVSGLGGNPYRDGSYAYYTREKVADNDPKGIGATIAALIETSELYTAHGTESKTVLLDYYFNNERRKDILGKPVRYHYTWEDQANSGFSLFGHLFRQYGGRTDSLAVAPTANNLRNASVYIIVDPDDEREVPDPHYPGPAAIAAIAGWVHAGGILVLMSNDSANAEFAHFNVLAGRVGIHFNFDDYHKVLGRQFEMGAFRMPRDNSIFRTAHKVYIKELSTLTLAPPAKAQFTDKGHIITAVARFGRGAVFAVGDPWFYNEYTDGRKLPPDYENYNAARDLVQWLLSQAH